MDPFTLLLTAIMAGLALTGAGVITTLVVLERPCAEPVAALSNGHRPRRRCRS